MPKNDTPANSPGTDAMSKALNSVFNSGTLRKLGRTRVGDPAPKAKKANPPTSRNQIAAEGYVVNPSGTLSYRKANGGSPPNPTKKGK